MEMSPRLPLLTASAPSMKQCLSCCNVFLSEVNISISREIQTFESYIYYIKCLKLWLAWSWTAGKDSVFYAGASLLCLAST